MCNTPPQCRQGCQQPYAVFSKRAAQVIALGCIRVQVLRVWSAPMRRRPGAVAAARPSPPASDPLPPCSWSLPWRWRANTGSRLGAESVAVTALPAKTVTMKAESFLATARASWLPAAATGDLASGRATGKQWRSCRASVCLRQVLERCKRACSHRRPSNVCKSPYAGSNADPWDPAPCDT